MNNLRIAVGLLTLTVTIACGTDKNDNNPTPRTDAGTDAGVTDSGAFDGSTQSMMLGPTGGTLQAGLAKLVVPPGALTAPTMLTIAEVNPTTLAPVPSGQQANGPVVAFLPHGTTFAMPVTIEVPYTAADASNVILNLDNDTDTSWAPETGAVFSNGVARLSVMHFCNKRSAITAVIATERLCNNQLDDDNDSAIDCADSDCAEAANCLPTPETNCTNQTDDDGDGAIDCADSDCAQATNCHATTETNCGNQTDDDGDGAIDCADTDCAGGDLCSATTETNCGDGVDDDGDGMIDCNDRDDCCVVGGVCCQGGTICIELQLCGG